MFPGDGPDTALARALLDLGVERGLLRTALDEVRRSQGGANLGSLLAGRGWVPAHTLGRAAETLRQGARPLASVPQLGSYRLVRELARGGMGAVYEAEQVETGARVALKRILPELLLGLDDEARARFRREAELSARLRVDGIVPVHAADLEGPQPYLVQAFCAGGSLQQRVAESGPLSPAEVRRLGSRLARSLAHAHAQGVVHRDLKPQNVLFDERGEAAITDFGLAAARGQGLTLTQSGEILGSPAYMPPEQIEDARRADARSDVYALGAVLYSALSGQAPFRGENVFEVLNRVLQVEPLPLSELVPGVPAGLRRVIERAMAKDPARRFPDAEALAVALEEPEPAAGEGPRAVWAAAALLLVLGAGGGAAWWGRREAPVGTPPPTPTSQPSDQATSEPERAPLPEFEARLLAGERSWDPTGLDASARSGLDALAAVLEGDLTTASAALERGEDGPTRRARLEALKVAGEAREHGARWSDPRWDRWAWPTSTQLIERAKHLDPRAGGLRVAAGREVQRAFARYLMFCPSREFEAVLRETDRLESVLALSADGATRVVLQAAFSRRLDQAEHAKWALRSQPLAELLARAPPSDLGHLELTDAFCLALVLTRLPSQPAAWRDLGLALGERVARELGGRPFVSRLTDLSPVLQRDMMVRYRERAFDAFAAGHDGAPDLARAVALSDELTDASDRSQAAITYVMAGNSVAAVLAIAEARQHTKRTVAAAEPAYAELLADMDYLEAELALCQGDAPRAGAILARLLDLGEAGLTGAADPSLAAEVFALQYHVHHLVSGVRDAGLLDRSALAGRHVIGVPWRTPAYTRRLAGDPQAWWPGKDAPSPGPR